MIKTEITKISYPQTGAFYIIFYTSGTIIHPDLRSKNLSAILSFILNPPLMTLSLCTKYILNFSILSLFSTTIFSLWRLFLSLFHTTAGGSIENANRIRSLTTQRNPFLPICLRIRFQSVMGFRKPFLSVSCLPFHCYFLLLSFLLCTLTLPSVSPLGSAPSSYTLCLNVELLPTLSFTPG